MECSVKDLSKARFDQAIEMLEASRLNLEIGQIKTSINRSYYAIFHAIRAVNALDEFDSSKHTGVIGHFNQAYIKTKRLDVKNSDVIKRAYYLREKSDYDDFYIASREDAHKQLEEATLFVKEIEEYLIGRKVLQMEGHNSPV